MRLATQRHSKPRRRRRSGVLIAAGTAAVAVAGVFVLAGGRGPEPRPQPVSVVTNWSPAPPLTSTVATSPAAAPSPDPPADVALEHPPEAPPPGPAALPALTTAQAADPEAVAARFLVTYATFDAGEVPAAIIDARLAELATPSLAEELQRDSSASAALEDLQIRNVAFAGEVVEISTSERTGSRAIVVAVVEHTTIVDGVVDPDFRVVPYTLTLVRSGPGWLVAGITP